eukprot:1158900-Pelagomonas_calceolata.AAC.1
MCIVCKHGKGGHGIPILGMSNGAAERSCCVRSWVASGRQSGWGHLVVTVFGGRMLQLAISNHEVL